jgi:hypothetical protein
MWNWFSTDAQGMREMCKRAVTRVYQWTHTPMLARSEGNQ